MRGARRTGSVRRSAARADQRRRWAFFSSLLRRGLAILLGFVSRFLRQGSGFVIASLWPIPDRTTATFLAGFYQQLAAGTDVAGALRQTKLALLESGPSGNVQWASFQLFSR